METKPIKNIFQRILAVMAEVDYIQKGDKKVANQYKYVSHDQVSEAIHPQLVKHGIAVVPTVKSMTQEENRTVMCLAVGFINVDNPEDRFVIESWGYGIDTGDKGPGKSYSYAFKYAILKTFMLETGDDPDHDQESKFGLPITRDQYEELLEMDVEHMQAFKANVFKHFDIKDYSQLKAKDYEAVYSRMKTTFERGTQ